MHYLQLSPNVVAPLANDLCYNKHCWGVNEKNKKAIWMSTWSDDGTAKRAIIASVGQVMFWLILGTMKPSKSSLFTKFTEIKRTPYLTLMILACDKIFILAGIFFCTSADKCKNGGQCDEFNDRCDCVNGYTGATCEGSSVSALKPALLQSIWAFLEYT